jgi:hypothetical protein
MDYMKAIYYRRKFCLKEKGATGAIITKVIWVKQVISRNGYGGTVKLGALRAKRHVYPSSDFLNVMLTA